MQWHGLTEIQMKAQIIFELERLRRIVENMPREVYYDATTLQIKTLRRRFFQRQMAW